MSKLESETSDDIQVSAREENCTLLRNNSGACTDETGRQIRYGLGNISKKHNERSKSSDFIGITQIKITPDMVGKNIGVFTAIECKKEAWNKNKKLDKKEQAQKNFIDWVKYLGGIAGFANSAEEVKKIIKGEL